MKCTQKGEINLAIKSIGKPNGRTLPISLRLRDANLTDNQMARLESLNLQEKAQSNSKLL